MIILSSTEVELLEEIYFRYQEYNRTFIDKLRVLTGKEPKKIL